MVCDITLSVNACQETGKRWSAFWVVFKVAKDFLPCQSILFNPPISGYYPYPKRDTRFCLLPIPSSVVSPVNLSSMGELSLGWKFATIVRDCLEAIVTIEMYVIP